MITVKFVIIFGNNNPVFRTKKITLMAMVNRPIKSQDQIQVQESQPQMDQNQILKVQNRAP